MKKPLLNNKELLKKYLDELKIFNFQHKSSLFIIVGILAIVIGIGLYIYFDSNLTVKLFGFDLGAVLAIFFGVVLIVALFYVAERRVGLNAGSLEYIVLNSDVTEEQVAKYIKQKQQVAEYIEQRIKETKENNQPKTEDYTEGSGFNDGRTVDKTETTGGMTQDIKNDLYKSIMNEAFKLYNTDNNRQQEAILMLNFIVGHKFFRGCPMITYGDYNSYLIENHVNKAQANADISNPMQVTQSPEYPPTPAGKFNSDPQTDNLDAHSPAAACASLFTKENPAPQSTPTFSDEYKGIMQNYNQSQDVETLLTELEDLSVELRTSLDGIGTPDEFKELNKTVNQIIQIYTFIDKASNIDSYNELLKSILEITDQDQDQGLDHTNTKVKMLEELKTKLPKSDASFKEIQGKIDEEISKIENQTKYNDTDISPSL